MAAGGSDGDSVGRESHAGRRVTELKLVLADGQIQRLARGAVEAGQLFAVLGDR